MTHLPAPRPELRDPRGGGRIPAWLPLVSRLSVRPWGAGFLDGDDDVTMDSDRRAGMLASQDEAVACLSDACRRLPADALHQMASAAYADDAGELVAWMAMAPTWQLRIAQLAILTGLRAAFVHTQEDDSDAE